MLSGRRKLDPELPPKTWYEAAKTLGVLVESGQSCGLTTAWQSWVLVENMSAWHNQRFATQGNGMASAAGASDARLTFNTRLMVRWISMLSSWNKAGYFTYSGRKDEAEARFASGECAMLTSSSAAYVRLRKRAGFDLGVAQLPYYDDFDDAPQNTLVGGSALWVMAGASAAQYRGVASFFAYLSVPRCRSSGRSAPAAFRSPPPRTSSCASRASTAATPSKRSRCASSSPSRPRIPAAFAWAGCGSSAASSTRSSSRCGTTRKTPLDALNAAVQRGNLLLENANKPGESGGVEPV